MRHGAYLITFGLIASALSSAAEIEFNGIISDSAGDQLAFHDTASRKTEWLRIGEQFEGYSLASYDPKEQIAELTKNGVTTKVRFSEASVHNAAVAATQLSPAKAKAIFNNLRQLSAAADQYYLEHGVTTASYENLVGPNTYIKSLSSVAGEDYSSVVFDRRNLIFSVKAANGDSVTWDLMHNGGAEDQSTFIALKPGDTFAKIAQQTGKSPQDLAGMNDDVNPRKLKVGELVRVR